MRVLPAALVLAAGPALAGNVYDVGPGQPFANLQAVQGLLGPGDLVRLQGNATYPGGVLFQNHGTAAEKITIQGIRVNGLRPVVSGGSDGLKLDADHYVLESLDFTASSNRCLFLQGDDLVVRDTVVHDCPHHGILGADQDTGDVTLEHVEVHHNGSGTQYHQIYMSADEEQFPNAVFRLRFSYVHDANGGNSVKSRAARNEIHYNWIEGALYHELDLIGAELYAEGLVREDSEVVGNVFVKTAASQGRVARIGGDGTGQTDGRYRFAHNTMILAASAGTPTVISLQDQAGSLQLSDNVIYRQGGGPFVAVRTADEAAPLAVHAGQNNWVASNATGLRPEWTGTVTGTNPGFANLAAWNLTPTVGGAIHDTGVLPTAGPPGASFPNPLAAPLFHPPVRAIGLPGSEQARPTAPPIDIGAYEANSAPVVPQMTIDDAAVTEGSSGTTPATFVVRLSTATTVPVTVGYATANGTATAPADYAAASGTLTFAAGATAQNVVVSVVGDALVEPDETFVLNLSGAAGATLADAQGAGAIADDDAPPLAGVELAHGTALVRSLQGTSGQETFRLAQAPRTSYEVLVDAASGDISPAVLERLAADQSTVAQGSSAVGTGTGRRLAWHNTSASVVSNQALRVRSTGCTTACGPEDTFRVRAWDTTYTVPRFNNSGTQGTVLIVQNATERALAGRAYFWSAAGTLLGSHAFALNPHATLVLNTATVAGVAGQGGSVTLAHDGGYGALAGKAVALEPATGFSFDSPMAPRAR
jgi:Calx-beta domain-containing protein